MSYLSRILRCFWFCRVFKSWWTVQEALQQWQQSSWKQWGMNTTERRNCYSHCDPHGLLRTPATETPSLPVSMSRSPLLASRLSRTFSYLQASSTSLQVMLAPFSFTSLHRILLSLNPQMITSKHNSLRHGNHEELTVSRNQNSKNFALLRGNPNV